jgi:hypothetical protein
MAGKTEACGDQISMKAKLFLYGQFQILMLILHRKSGFIKVREEKTDRIQ